MKNDSTATQTWPELAAGLDDQRTGRGSEVSCEMSDLDVMVPSGPGAEATQARWTVNGTLKIRTQDHAEN